MKTSVTLKQLRTNPHEYIRLLNSGYEVDITEHRKTIARSVQPKKTSKPQKGDVRSFLETIKKLPPLATPHPDMDTVDLIKKTRLEGYEAKRREIEKQRAGH